MISEAYAEVVHWRKNVFSVPFGKVGKIFVSELARLFRAYAEGSSLESVALKAVSVFSALSLQKPHSRSKPREHIACLSRRLDLWMDGKVTELLFEGRSIQQRLLQLHNNPQRAPNWVRAFTNLMFQGRTKAALRLLSDSDSNGVLQLNELVSSNDSDLLTVREVLELKHPPAQPRSLEASIVEEGMPPIVHPVIYDRLDACSIRSAALHTYGAGGPSRTDAYCWRRFCTAFKQASSDLCHSLSLVTRKLCSVHVDPETLSPLLACRLIALNKNPGVRPIGVCETARRIIAKAVLSTFHEDILEASGALQLCGGQVAGVEAAIHAIRSCFQEESTEGVLLVDATNAFNSLNRQTALYNIQFLCPTLATLVINCCRNFAELFVGGSMLQSAEGTTQGDLLAMPLYALATVPLIRKLSFVSPIKQVWYADDATAAGSLIHLRLWWDALVHSWPWIRLLCQWL